MPTDHAPGRLPASARPRRKRTARKDPSSCTAAMQPARGKARLGTFASGAEASYRTVARRRALVQPSPWIEQLCCPQSSHPIQLQGPRGRGAGWARAGTAWQGPITRRCAGMQQPRHAGLSLLLSICACAQARRPGRRARQAQPCGCTGPLPAILPACQSASPPARQLGANPPSSQGVLRARGLARGGQRRACC